eukprot:m.58972 g.58972  ORF g.58972 m.58972 type:complete len:73 (-) comp13802_c0_seq2:2336-2554(-)
MTRYSDHFFARISPDVIMRWTSSGKYTAPSLCYLSLDVEKLDCKRLQLYLKFLFHLPTSLLHFIKIIIVRSR